MDRPELGTGNVQAAARETRYAAAERLRRARGLDWIATGHTRTDLAETVLYRLAISPGRRALLGLRLAAARSSVRCSPWIAIGSAAWWPGGLALPRRPTNPEPLYARNRIRNEVLPVLREIGPGAEGTIAETHAELAEEAETLEGLAAEALAESAAPKPGCDRGRCRWPRWTRRSGGWRCGGWPSRRGPARAARPIEGGGDLAARQRPEGGVVELGGGVEARAEHGHVRFSSGRDAEPAEARWRSRESAASAAGRCAPS